MRTPPKRIRKRPREPVASPARPSMGMALFGREFLDAGADSGGKSVLLVVPRVGSIEHITVGYELNTCNECEHAVWCNAGFVASCKRKGNRLCITCQTCSLGDYEMVGQRPGA